MRFKSLDALRGIAAVIVVIHHCLVTLPVWSNVMLHGVHNSLITTIVGYPPLDLLWAGNAAVRVFFALSGFVLALMLLRPDPPSYAAFLVKRVCRIYLPYAVVVAAAMFLMTATAPHDTPELSEWFNTTSWNQRISGSLILDHTLMLGRPEYNFVDNPIWSLVHEMRYSLIFPVIIWLVARVKWRALIGGAWLISVAAVAALSHTGNNWAVASLQYAFLFVAGAELANHRMEVAAWFRNLAPARRTILMVTSLLLLSAHGFNHTQIYAVRGFAYLAPDIGAVGLLTCLVGSRRIQTMVENKPCLWLGRVSYSLYLSHLVVLLTLVSAMHRFVPIYAILVVFPPLALVVAGVLYRLLEAPAIALGHNLAARIESKGGSIAEKAAQGVAA